MEEGLNPNDTGMDLFGRRMRELCIPLISPLRNPGLEHAPLNAVAGIAGAGEPGMMSGCKAILESILKPYGSSLRLRAMTDVDALAWACIGEGSGIVIIAGTGSICLGVGRRDGRRITWRVGGEGSFCDEGSGSILGLRVLNAAMRAVESDCGQTMLVRLVCERYGIEPQEIRPHFVPPERQKVADLARLAFDASAQGDGVARRLIDGSASDLVELVEEVKSGGGFRDPMKVFASGGLFRSPVMRRVFRAHLEKRIPGTALTFVYDPVMRMLGGLLRMGSGTDQENS
jgi:N-acetylglucosamine kinase-like BadF-type ATPase